MDKEKRVKTGIKTVYYDRHFQPVKHIHSKYPNTAVVNCVGRMQVNQYGASCSDVDRQTSREKFPKVV